MSDKMGISLRTILFLLFFSFSFFFHVCAFEREERVVRVSKRYSGCTSVLPLITTPKFSPRVLTDLV